MEQPFCVRQDGITLTSDLRAVLSWLEIQLTLPTTPRTRSALHRAFDSASDLDHEQAPSHSSNQQSCKGFEPNARVPGGYCSDILLESSFKENNAGLRTKNGYSEISFQTKMKSQHFLQNKFCSFYFGKQLAEINILTASDVQFALMVFLLIF